MTLIQRATTVTVAVAFMLLTVTTSASARGTNVGQQYLSIAAQLQADKAQAANLYPRAVTPPYDDSQAIAFDRAVIDATARSDQRLLALKVSGRSRKDISALVANDRKLIEILQAQIATGHPTACAVACAGLSALDRLQSEHHAIANRVRRDLHLPVV